MDAARTVLVPGDPEWEAEATRGDNRLFRDDNGLFRGDPEWEAEAMRNTYTGEEVG